MKRVVTGHDEEGHSVIILEGAPPTVIDAGTYVMTELWITDPAMPPVAGADPSTREWAAEPPAGGTCFRIVEIPPVARSGEHGASDGDQRFFYGAHRTDTLDYVTVLRGEVTLIVGDSEVALLPGDSVIQQPGVLHDWQNRSTEPCVLAGVLISAR
jgi:quercetin dioxygenase-like cupin family protein